VPTETSLRDSIRQFIWEDADQQRVGLPGVDDSALLAAVPELDIDRLAGEPDPRVFVSGWPDVTGVLVLGGRTAGPDGWQAVVAARDERALRDLLLGFPLRASGVLYLSGRWMLAAVQDLFAGEELPGRVSYYATQDTFVPAGAGAGAGQAGLPGRSACARRPLGGGLHQLMVRQDEDIGSDVLSDAIEQATAEALADGQIAFLASISTERSKTIGVLEALGYRLFCSVTVFRGARRGGRVPAGSHAGGEIDDGRVPDPPVVSKDAPVLQRFRALKEPAARRAEAAFVAEGRALVQRAIADGLPVESVLCRNELMATAEGSEILRACDRAGITCLRCSDGLMGTITSTRPLPAVIAAIHFALRDVETLRTTSTSALLVAEDLQNPDNLGMVVRTADGAGAGAVVVTTTGVDPLHKNCVRAARGAVGRIPLYTCGDLPRWLRSLAERGFTVVGATAHADADLYAQVLRPPLVIVVGNEETGLRQETLAACTTRVRIPMAPGQSSLNVAVAAGVLLFELVRQSGRQ